MNREEALLVKTEERTSYTWLGAKVVSYVSSKFFASRINNIYNDFESRTCENCKHYFNAITRDENNNGTTTPACIKFCLDDGEYTLYPSKDFGCNKFERKV